MNRLNSFATVSALAVTLAVTLAGCGEQKTVSEPVRPVLLHTVASAVVDRDAFTGEIKARIETDLGFRIGGKIVERLVDAGAQVKRGQAIARLDPQDARLAAQAGRAQVTAAESELALAKSELDRSADLLAKKFISQSAFDNRKNIYNAAAARLDQAKASAAVQGNQAAYTTLLADADGLVSQVFAEAGQVVNVGQPVVRLARAGAKEVLISVAESQLARFKVGQPVQVFMWANAGANAGASAGSSASINSTTSANERFAGSVREIAGSPDTATRTYAVRVSLDNPPESARLGMTANVLLTQATQTAAAVVVPLGAVDKRGDQTNVWLFDAAKKTVTPKPVQVAEWREEGAVIKGGVANGDVIVAAGTYKLMAGQTVKVYGDKAPVVKPVAQTSAQSPAQTSKPSN
jgi:membrane fusion protein, multidrug efflux system